jgi:hypothetical protein
VNKTVFAIVLLALIIVAAAIYVLVINKPESAGAKNTFTIDSSGGTVTTSDGKVKFDLPADALINQTDITIKPIQNDVVAGYTIVSTYQFEPKGTYFLTPATINITYNPDNLPAGLNEADLRLFANVAAGFGQLENSSVDTVNHIVSGQVHHFSHIYVGASQSTPEPKNATIVGKWDRTDGVDKYTFFASGVTQTIMNGQVSHGTWGYDGSPGNNYVMHWEHSPPGKAPFIDWITIANNGQSYSGHNNYNNSIHCIRVDKDQPPHAAIEPPVPPNTIEAITKFVRVEKEITLHSASTDPDDPPSMLNYLWTVKSPNGEVVATSTPDQQVTAFTPHIVGDYVASLTVSDAISKDSTAITITVRPNVQITPISLAPHAGEPADVLDVRFTLQNFGEQPIEVEITVRLWGDRASGGDFEIGPYLVNNGEDWGSGPYIDLPGVHQLEGGQPMEISGTVWLPTATEPTTDIWTIDIMPYNARLTVNYAFTNAQTYRYIDMTYAQSPLKLGEGIDIYARYQK